MYRQGLFTLTRGGYEEITIEGEIVVSDGKEVLYRSSEVAGIYPARSLLKPFQFLAANLPESRWDERFAPALGSISATEAQVERLREWYSTAEGQELITLLQVPASYPMDEKKRAALKNAGTPPAPL